MVGFRSPSDAYTRPKPPVPAWKVFPDKRPVRGELVWCRWNNGTSSLGALLHDGWHWMPSKKEASCAILKRCPMQPTHWAIALEGIVFMPGPNGEEQVPA